MESSPSTSREAPATTERSNSFVVDVDESSTEEWYFPFWWCGSREYRLDWVWQDRDGVILIVFLFFSAWIPPLAGAYLLNSPTRETGSERIRAFLIYMALFGWWSLFSLLFLFTLLFPGDKLRKTLLETLGRYTFMWPLFWLDRFILHGRLGEALLRQIAVSSTEQTRRTAVALIDRDVAVNGIRKSDGYTALMIAVLNQDLNMVKLLLEKDAEVNQIPVESNRYTTTPIFIAQSKGYTEGVREILEMRPEKVNLERRYGAKSQTVLVRACREGQSDIANLLIEHRANVNVKDSFGMTPLHAACFANSLMIVQALILKDADTDAKMNNGETPLQIAENQKNSDIMDSLETDDRPKKFSLTNHTVTFRVNNRTLLGEGAHGKVVSGYLKSHATGHVFTVAVKSMKPDDELPFRNEIKFLTTCTHENIVRFYGAKASPSRLYIVMEYCDGGTLWDYVHSHENSLDTNTLLLWMYQCARGLEFLHDKGKIHRDIKTANLLLSRETIKISDFGIARSSLDVHSQGVPITHHSRPVGTLAYLAPELAEEKNYTSKSDLYAFGIVLWECAARKKPLEIANLGEFATRVCRGNERPEGDFNVDVPDGYRALVRACWHENVTARPTTKDVLSTLTAMHQTLSKRASTSG
jgi:hypothetical protein